MSIFVDENTRAVYQGLTGSPGRFYGKLNREYGTDVVAGTNPKKAGEDVDYVIPDDVKEMVRPVFLHRLVCRGSRTRGENGAAGRALEELLKTAPVPL
mgnify:CR=1 FL=1